MIERLSEIAAVVSIIKPGRYAVSTENGNTIDMKNYEQLAFILSIGDMASTGTIDYKIQGSASSDMSNPVDLTGKKIAVITVSQDEVTNQSVRYIRDLLTIAAAASFAGAVALATTRYQPASDFDLATVVQNVN